MSTVPLLHIEGGVATLTLNRPQHRNRLQLDDLQVLLAHIEALQHRSDVRLVLLTAQVLEDKPVFSAGFDLGAFEAEGGQASVGFEAVPDALARLPQLTLAAINGSIYGGATDLAMACDFRIGVTGMLFKIPAAALGLHYYPSGMQRFVARLGLGAARRIFLKAEQLRDIELLHMGYLDELIVPEHWAIKRDAWVQHLAAMAPLAVQGMKQTLNEMAHGEINDALRRRWHSREQLTQLSHDFAEGRRAHAEKRAPHFLNK